MKYKNKHVADGHSLVCSKLENGNYEVMVALVGNWKTRRMNVTMQRLQEMTRNFEADIAAGRQLLFDYDHLSMWGESSKAAGWGVALAIREDKLYCEMKPTESGRAAIEAGEYKYLSPVFVFRRENHVTGEIMEDWYLESVALTNVPFLTELPAITNKKNDVEVKHMEWWKTLGYTSEEEAIKGINSQKSELAEANRINAELQTKLTAEQAKTAELLSKANAAEVEAVVLAKKILPGQKEIALKLINSDRGLFDEFVAANAGVRIEGLSTETVIPESEKKDPLSQVSSYKQLLDDKALCAKFEAEKPEDYKALYHRWMTEKK